MRLVAPDDPDVSIPITIGVGDSLTGPRFGGEPPSGVEAPVPTGSTRYFLTIPLSTEPLLDLTVFLSFGLEESLEQSGVLGAGQGLIQLVPHVPAPRAGSSRWRSEFPPHPLVLGEVRQDWTLGEDGSRVHRSSHKVGGRPYFMHGEEIDDQVEQLWESGYRQFLQMDFPGSDDALLDVDWPFGDGVFHVLGLPPFSPDSWRCFGEN